MYDQFSLTESQPTPITLGQVVSKDGTLIGYRQLGSGPGLIVLHGGLLSSKNYLVLANALAEDFTVYLPDRRGRGLSGPMGEEYNATRECEDLAAMMKYTGARQVFGHSAGGLFALEAALALPITRLAVYEPAVSIQGSIPSAWLPAYTHAIGQGKYAQAMSLFVHGMPFNWMGQLPVWLLQAFFSLMLRGPEAEEIIPLLQAGVYEMETGIGLDSTCHRYSHISAETLLIGGSKSPKFLLGVLPQLEEIIPNSRRLLLPGFTHTAPNEDAPQAIAEVLKGFFLVEQPSYYLTSIRSTL